MALTKTILHGMGLTEEQVTAIMEGHLASISALQEKVENYQNAEKESKKTIADLQKDLEDAKTLAIEKEGKNPWKVKYDALNEEFTSYKTEEQKKATKAAKENAYKALLKESGVAEKRIGSVLRVSDIESLELGEDGKFKNSEDLAKKIKEEWADFITSKGQEGANTPNPPKNNGAPDDGDHSAAKRIAEQRAMLYGSAE